MAKYKVVDRKVLGDYGHVNLSKVLHELRGLQLEDKWNSKADGYSDSMLLRDVADKEDYHLLAKRYGKHLILAKTPDGSFMITQAVSEDWEGRYAIKVTQKELEELFN